MLLWSFCLLVFLRFTAASEDDDGDAAAAAAAAAGDDQVVQRIMYYSDGQMRNSHDVNFNLAQHDDFDLRADRHMNRPDPPRRQKSPSALHRNPSHNIDSLRKEAFKATLLKKLRMTRAPNITSLVLPRIPYLEEKWREAPERLQNDEAGVGTEDFENGANSATLRMMHFCKYEDILHLSRCKFKVKSSRFGPQHVVNATLGVYVRIQHFKRFNLPDRRFATTSLKLIKYTKNGSRRTVASKAIIGSSPGTWVEFEVKNLVQDWLHSPEMNLGVEFEVDEAQRIVHAGVYQLIEFPIADENLDKQPYLDIAFEEDSASRRMRRHATNVCEEGSSDYRCCRYPLHIDFREMQWDWIILPTSYDAYYCSGDCPFLFQQNNAFAHTASQTGIPAACCSAKSVSSIELIYYDEHHNIVNGKVPGMAVDSCSCG